MTEAPHDDRQPAADIATAIGQALAQATETTATSQTEDAAEIQAIIDAMVRLLVGVPLRSDGQLTIKSLAEEADLRRNKLTHKHTGLKDLFYALTRSQNHRPKIADQLQADNDQLRKKLADLRAKTHPAQRTGRDLRPRHPRPGSRKHPATRAKPDQRRRPPTATTNPLTQSPFNTTATGFDSKEQSFINNTPRLDTEDHYRPDPSYIPEIEQEIRKIKADVLEAQLCAAPQVVDNLRYILAMFEGILAKMTANLERLDEEERAALDAAIGTIRRARDLHRNALPLFVIDRPAHDNA